MGDNKIAEEYFQEVIQKARVSESDHLAHFLINYGMLNIQMVRNNAIVLYSRTFQPFSVKNKSFMPELPMVLSKL